MVAASSKKVDKDALSKRSGAQTLFKSKLNVKENDRVARMKAAREAYSKLSKERAVRHSAVHTKPESGKKSVRPAGNIENENQNPETTSSPSRAFVFKPMASSLDMIRNNRIRIPNAGRASSIAGARSLGPRPSLLPLGINVFESNVSVTDQQKVRDFVAARLNTGTTPKKTACSLSFDPQTDASSARGSRTVRFCVEATISEQRESGSDEILQGVSELQSKSLQDQPGTFAVSPVPQSILKKRAKDPLFRKPQSPKTPARDSITSLASRATPLRRSIRKEKSPLPVLDSVRHQLSFASTASDESTLAPVKAQTRIADEQRESDFVKCYT
ncbi:hypothetical protein Y032_0454g1739 [Ancylostoma ceylanicum]|nr:hypothetical protein Y032_0454g1739 [Ancylostoma ceylanicum]